MLLAAVADLRAQLGFDDMTDINAAITGALHAAEPYLAAVLGTEFEETERADVFYVHEPGLQQGAHVQTEFRLRQGFVQADTLTVEIGNAYAFEDPTEVTSDVILQTEKGVVTDYQTVYDRDYVRVTYTAGFAVDDDDADSYDLSVVPAWLQEAAKLQALITLETHPSLEGAGIKQDTNKLNAQLGHIVRRHMRYAPVALLPI
jgi:hypothetical protein